MRAPLLLLALLAVLTGCVQTEPLPPSLPAGVSVGVQQSRTDVVAGELSVAVSNESPDAIEVVGARLDAEQFLASTRWDRARTTIRPGTTANLSMALPDAACTSAPGDATVELDLRAGDRATTYRGAAADLYDRLPALQAEQCLAEQVAADVEIALGDLVTATVGGRPAGVLPVTITPTGTGSPLTIDGVLGTTLLGVADPVTGVRVDETLLGIRIDRDAETFDVTLVPGRCDAHAIAEDKRGTILPLRVTTSAGISGVVDVPADPDLKSTLIGFVKAACGDEPDN